MDAEANANGKEQLGRVLGGGEAPTWPGGGAGPGGKGIDPRTLLMRLLHCNGRELTCHWMTPAILTESASKRRILMPGRQRQHWLPTVALRHPDTQKRTTFTGSVTGPLPRGHKCLQARPCCQTSFGLKMRMDAGKGRKQSCLSRVPDQGCSGVRLRCRLK